MITAKNSVVKIKTDNVKGNATLFIRAEKPVTFVVFTVESKDGKSYRFEYENNSVDFKGAFSIESPILWSISNPNLYTYKLEITYTEEVETVTGTFGFRTLTTNGKEVCLNGTPVFIRGYIRGTTAHDHANNAGLSEEEFYRKSIAQSKRFGFNYVRFHSVVPNETFFKIAGEEGNDILFGMDAHSPEEILETEAEKRALEMVEKFNLKLLNAPLPMTFGEIGSVPTLG